jgi:hypothetical protein
MDREAAGGQDGWHDACMVLRRQSATRALCLITGLVVLGCGSSGDHTSTPTPTSAPTPTGVGSSTPAAVTACQASAIAASQGQSDSAAGRIVYAIVLTNTGPQSCTMDGYPTVTLADTGGTLPTTQTNGNDGVASVSTTPAVVAIAAGDAASFVLQYVDVATGTQSCPTATQLQIVLPGGGGMVLATVNDTPCGGELDVSPVRAGIAPP